MTFENHIILTQVMMLGHNIIYYMKKLKCDTVFTLNQFNIYR